MPEMPSAPGATIPGMPTEWPRFYSTALFDPAGGRQLRFLVAPERSLPKAPGGAGELADRLGLREAGRLEPLEPWSLPFLLDAMTGRGYMAYPLGFEFPWRDLPPRGRGPTGFAQEAVFAPLLPVEASPVRGRSLASLIVSGGATSAIGLYAQTGDPVAVVYAGGVTVLFTAAWPVLLWLEARVAHMLGVELEWRAADEEPPTGKPD